MIVQRVETGVEFDSLGAAVLSIPDPRGWPSYVKSKEDQALVTLLRRANWVEANIANCLESRLSWVPFWVAAEQTLASERTKSKRRAA